MDTKMLVLFHWFFTQQPPRCPGAAHKSPPLSASAGCRGHSLLLAASSVGRRSTWLMWLLPLLVAAALG
jgi:hypothetical protein